MPRTILNSFFCCSILLICLSYRCAAETEEFFRKYINEKNFSIEPDADAVVLYEKGSTKIELDRNNRYVIKYELNKAIKILKPAALDLANVRLFSYNSESYNTYVNYFKATTYNWDGQDMTATKLSKDDKYWNKISKNNYEYSITLPSVKEGSIIEYSYQIEAPMSMQLPPWQFQDELPKLYSSYQIAYPARFQFTSKCENIVFKKYDKRVDAEKDNAQAYYVFTEVKDTYAPFSIATWVRLSVPSLKEEPYISNIENYRERVETQLSGYAVLGFMGDHITTWWGMNDGLWKSKNYGQQILDDNKFMSSITDSITKASSTDIEKAKNIYAYVRGHFEKTYNSMHISDDLDKVFKNKKGNSTDINLLLIAMLRQANLDAYPLILSTSGKTRADSSYPMLNMFNYTAGVLKMNDTRYLLDASGKNNIFGMLPQYCYNGYARIVNEKHGEAMTLSTNDIKDKMVYVVSISNITDTTMKFDVTEKLGLLTSIALRNKWSQDSTLISDFLEKRANLYGAHVTIENNKIENLHNIDTNLIVKYTCSVKTDKKIGTYYINTMFNKFFKENPFKEIRRILPIEFPEKMDCTSIVNINLPADYEPDDLPQPAILNFEEKQLFYSEQVGYTKEIHMISVNTHFELNETIFTTRAYETLRNFFEKIVQRENGTIILKKIN